MHNDNLYPTSSLTFYQNGIYYIGTKIFNKLPPEEFLRKLFSFHHFYIREEFYSLNG
jgi:hypothetical protein